LPQQEKQTRKTTTGKTNEKTPKALKAKSRKEKEKRMGKITDLLPTQTYHLGVISQPL